MTDPEGFSESGHPIFRHQARDRDFEPDFGDPETIAAVEAHIEEHFGTEANVLHELVSDIVHIDLHLIAPSSERPFHTIVTSGMSSKPMSTPKGTEEFRFAELMLSLPSEWPVSEDAFDKPENYWPLGWLKLLARLPHQYDTWLGWGHSVPNGDPSEPFASNTLMSGTVLLEPRRVPPGFFELNVNEWKTVRFFGVVPLYAEEMHFKLKHGTEALEERLLAEGVTELLDPKRPPVVPKRLGGSSCMLP